MLPVLAALWGCTGVGEPTGGLQPPADDLPASAFSLVIDVRTGQVEVSAPGATASATTGGPSYSLIGNDAVEMDAGPCTFTSIPGNPRKKRCTFALRIDNQLDATDLVTPTTFPRPPAGVTGVLVFPLTASAQGGTEAVAVASPAWDRAPANFFNDHGGCDSGSKSDCYRYEVYGSPLYAGENESREVGFDVPIDATSVTAYIVVAADLRDNPEHFIRLNAFRDLSGQIGLELGAPVVLLGGVLDDAILELGPDQLVLERDLDANRVFLSFSNHFLGRPDVRIRSADLRVHHYGNGFYASPLAEYLDYGASLDPEDYDLPSTSTPRRMFGSSEDFRQHQTFHVQVQEAADQGAAYFQFRLQAEDEESHIRLDGLEGLYPPHLTIHYTLK